MAGTVKTPEKTGIIFEQLLHVTIDYYSYSYNYCGTAAPSPL